MILVKMTKRQQGSHKRALTKRKEIQMTIEDVLTDDLFDEIETSNTSFGIVPKGTYRLRVSTEKAEGQARVRTGKASGDRYLSVIMAPVATKTGEAVSGSAIFHTVPFEGTFEGTDKDGNTVTREKAVFFAQFFTGLGLDRSQVRSVLESVFATAPAATDTGDKGTNIGLSINGEPFSLEGRELMGSVRIEEYNGKESNKIGKVWPLA